jgi:hypothetical protein
MTCIHPAPSENLSAISIGLDTFHCTMHKINAVMVKAMNDRWYFKSTCFIFAVRPGEIIKVLFRMVMYSGTKPLFTAGRLQMPYLEKS